MHHTRHTGMARSLRVRRGSDTRTLAAQCAIFARKTTGFANAPATPTSAVRTYLIHAGSVTDLVDHETPQLVVETESAQGVDMVERERIESNGFAGQCAGFNGH